jgi:uncharacterized membrane protein YedE/YeeE
MAERVAGALIGLVFGFVVVWSGMISPNVIRGALLFENSYLFLFFAAAVGTAALGLALVRRRSPRALLTGAPVRWTRDHVERRHVAGALLFGTGWGIANVCPAPIAAQLGQGMAWALPVATGVVIGVALHLRRNRTETEPAADDPAEPATDPWIAHDEAKSPVASY